MAAWRTIARSSKFDAILQRPCDCRLITKLCILTLVLVVLRNVHLSRRDGLQNLRGYVEMDQFYKVRHPSSAKRRRLSEKLNNKSHQTEDEPEDVEENTSKTRHTMGNSVKTNPCMKSSDGEMAQGFCRDWYGACHEIVDSEHDFVTYEQGQRCWEKCPDVLVVHALGGFVGQMQSRIQSWHWVQKLFPKIPFVPLCISSPTIWLLSTALVYITLAFIIPQDGSFRCAQMSTLLLFVLPVSVASWFTIMQGTAFVGCGFANSVEELETILMDSEYAWAGPWCEPVVWLKSYYLPPWAFYHLGLPVLLFYMQRWAFFFDHYFKSKSNAAEKKKHTILKKFYNACSGVGLVAFCNFAPSWFCSCIMVFAEAFDYGLESGTHGVVWTCSKAASGAKFGWVPPLGPYGVGFVYLVCSVVHGLLTQPLAIIPSRIPDPRKKKYCVVPDPVIAVMALMIKFIALLFDILTDVAQSILFFIRGQPYFGLMNTLGVLFQIWLSFVAAAQGKARDVTPAAAMLQSDLISNFRSSLSAGMPLLEFHEKAYRESYGETHLSMCLGILAFYLTQFRFLSDLWLMLLSCGLSMNSLRTGLAESRELVAAEHALALPGINLEVSILPQNDYYARDRYAAVRHMKTVSILRMSEALVGVTTIAVCTAAGSVRATYIVSVIASFAMFMPLYVKMYWKVLFDEWKKPFATEDVLTTIVVMIFIIPVVLAWFILFAAGPFLSLQLLVCWGGSVTVPGPETQYDAASSLGLDPKLMFSSHDDFAIAYAQKVVYLFLMWASLFGFSYWKPEIFSLMHLYNEIRDGLFPDSHHDTDKMYQWHTAVKLLFLCGAVVGYFAMICTALFIRKCQGEWRDSIMQAANQCQEQWANIRDVVFDVQDRLHSKGLIAHTFSEAEFGIKVKKTSASLYQLLCAKVLDMVFGDTDRMIMYHIWVPPEEVSSLLDGLDGDLELTQELPNLRLKRGKLVVGGDIMLRKGLHFMKEGDAIPVNLNVKAFVMKLSQRLAPHPIILYFACRASDIKDTAENQIRERLPKESSVVRSFDSLGHHIQIISDKIGANLESPAFSELCTNAHVEALESLQSRLQDLASYCTTMTLSRMMPEMQEDSAALSAEDVGTPLLEDGEGTAASACQVMLSNLQRAADLVPSRDDILSAAGYEKPERHDD